MLRNGLWRALDGLRGSGSSAGLRAGIAFIALVFLLGATLLLVSSDERSPRGSTSVVAAIPDRSELTDQHAAAELPHRDLTDGEAVHLLHAVFGRALQGPAADLDELDVERYVSDHAAIVKSGDGSGRSVLVESTLPLRTPGRSGKEPVDLALQRSDKGLEAANSLVEIRMPDRLGQGIQLPDVGARISVAGAPADRAPSVTDESVAVYPNVAEDTDFAVALTPTGLETFTQLRTPAAPTTQTLRLDLPRGTELRATKEGGATAERRGERVLGVLPPTAFDAAGEPVAVELGVVGSALRIQVETDAETTYPVLVDPIVETYNWYSTETSTGIIGSTNGEQWSPVGGVYFNQHDRVTMLQGRPEPLEYGMRGLYIQNAGNVSSISAGAEGRWDYHIPRYFSDFKAVGSRPTSFIESMTLLQLGYFSYTPQASPVLRAGLWDEATGSWASLFSVGANELPYAYGQAVLHEFSYPYNFYNHQAGEAVRKGVKTARFGLVATETTGLVYRAAYAGSATVTIGDTDLPTFGSVEGPSQWVNQIATEPIKVTASDTGLGVKKVTLEPEGITPATQWSTEPVACNGSSPAPCPRTSTVSAKAYDPAVMPQGIHYVKAIAEDPLGNKSSTAAKAQVKVDHTAPTATLSGTITQQASLGKKKPAYTVVVNGADGTSEAPQSGAAKSVIKVDGNVVDESSPGCATKSCTLTREWTLESSQFSAGAHTVTATVYDGVGLSVTKSVNVELTPKPTLTLSGTLTEQATVGTTQPTYSLKAVAAGEGIGSSGAISTKIKVDGTTVKSGEAPCTTSACSMTQEWTLESAKYALGAHTVMVESTDAAGNVGTKALTIQLNHDSADPTIVLSGTMTQQASLGTSLSSYTLNVLAQDGTAELPGSGVVELTIKADGQVVDQVAPGCPTQNCSINRAWTLDSTKYLTGSHTIEVIAKDRIGRVGTKTLGISLTTKPSLGLSGTLIQQSTVGTSRPRYGLSIFSAGQGLAPFTASVFGGAGTGNGQFARPADMAIDAAGNVWVVDSQNSRLQKFDKEGNFISKFGSFGTTPGKLAFPTAVAIDAAGNLWVVDNFLTSLSRVQVFNSAGTLIRSFGSYGGANGQFRSPEGIAIDSQGRVWVADTGNNRLQQFNSNGEFIRAVGFGGVENGQLYKPRGIDVGAKDHVWVADGGNSRVQEFDAEGKFVAKFGSEGSAPGQFYENGGLDVDGAGNIWVADLGTDRLEKFGPGGTYLTTYGVSGSGAGQLNLSSPTGIVTDSLGRIWVTDSANNRLQRLTSNEPVQGISSEISVDGTVVDTSSSTCNPPVCVLSRVWQLDASKLSGGSHTVKVKVTDGAGNSAVKYLSVQVTPDTTDPALTVGGALFEAPEGWVEEKGYALTASATDSGYGVNSLVFKIDGTQVASTTQSCPEGGCSGSFSKTISLAGYSGGSHAAEVIATDGAGRTTTEAWTLNVAPEGQVTAAEAEDTLEAADETTESTVVAPTVEEISETERAAGNDPELVPGEHVGELEVRGVPDQTTIGVDPETGFVIETPDAELPVAAVTTGENATNHVIAEDAAAVAGNTRTNVDTVIRPKFNGTMTFQSIRNATAIEDFSWEVALAVGQSLKLVSSHAAVVEYEDGTVAFTISAEDAHDALGKTVPASISVAGNVLTLSVDHQGAAYTYPVVAGAGWEGSYSTEILTRPQTEQERIEEEEQKRREEIEALNEEAERQYYVEHPANIAWVGPPEPIPGGTDDTGASASSRGRDPFKVRWEMTQCLYDFGTGCEQWEEKMKGFFEMNGKYAWWKAPRQPSCSHSTGWGWHITQGPCAFVGPNHEKYGAGYHITARTIFYLSFLEAGERYEAFTVYGYGNGYISGPHDSDCICNPLP